MMRPRGRQWTLVNDDSAEGEAMTEHPNVARMVQGYERFAASDVDGVLRLLSDDVVWHVAGGCFAGDHHAIAHVRETATRAADGARLDVREAHVFHLDPDGRATEFWNVHADPEAYEAFFV